MRELAALAWRGAGIGQELFAFAKMRGYKPQWAYVQAKQRGWFK